MGALSRPPKERQGGSHSLGKPSGRGVILTGWEAGASFGVVPRDSTGSGLGFQHGRLLVFDFPLCFFSIFVTDFCFFPSTLSRYSAVCLVWLCLCSDVRQLEAVKYVDRLADG